MNNSKYPSSTTNADLHLPQRTVYNIQTININSHQQLPMQTQLMKNSISVGAVGSSMSPPHTKKFFKIARSRQINNNNNQFNSNSQEEEEE